MNMFSDANEPLALLVAVNPKVAKQIFRQNIYDAWNNQCAYCGEKANSLDHIIPKFRGGHTVRSNLVPACSCNHKKGSEEWRSWFQRQAFWSQDKENKITAWMEEELTTLEWNQLRQLVSLPKETKPIELGMDRLDDKCAA